ncbi:MAG: NAD(+) synthase [Oscillospiraceae bacterium]|jgi:NAD+ synthase (glutamine-hydrolysing)|nr:NAD(+) synthase [Oscillospiraceae bacterium]
MYGLIKVRAASPRVRLANPAENARSVIAAVLDAQAAHVQVLVLPELFLSGYTCGDLFRQDVLIDGCENALGTILRETAGTQVFCAVGLPVRSLGRLYNCAAVFQSGVLLGVVPKLYLPNHGEFYEKRWFTAGSFAELDFIPHVNLCGQECVPFGRIMFDIAPHVRCGVEICEDMWMPISPGAEYALRGANLLLNLSASNALVGKHNYRIDLLRQYSGKNLCGVVYASTGAGESSTDLVFSGACAAAENGTILTEGKRFRQDGTYCDACVDIQRLNAERENYTFYDNLTEYKQEFCTAAVKQPLTALPEDSIDRAFDPYPFVPSNEHERDERYAEILNIQSAALAQRLNHTGPKKLVLGLSGGLDSTLALLVCAKACTLLGRPAKDVLCVSMPGFGTSARTKNNAKSLAEAFGSEYREIDITTACEQHMRDIGHDKNIHNVTYENTQARERTQILMDIANACRGLLVGTGDLSELALGWCTYNADHMSMYGVNAGVPKTLVRHLVEYYAETNDSKSAILKDILDTPVSPELLPPDETGNITQKTEEILGDYAVHDFFLYHFLRFGTAPDKLLFMAKRAFAGIYDEATLHAWLGIFLRRFFGQQFKRSCLPDGPKVGTVSLSPRGDWRMPSDAAAAAWLANI